MLSNVLSPHHGGTEARRTIKKANTAAPMIHSHSGQPKTSPYIILVLLTVPEPALSEVEAGESGVNCA